MGEKPTFSSVSSCILLYVLLGIFCPCILCESLRFSCFIELTSPCAPGVIEMVFENNESATCQSNGGERRWQS